ncbi:MAG: hypothetical protein R3345_09255 [Fulvivirga sp.]|nr:hypothetical protein [Fulvivirga sp.]
MRYLVIVFCLLSLSGYSQKPETLYLVDHGYLKGKILGSNEIEMQFLLNNLDSLSIRWQSVEYIRYRDLTHTDPLTKGRVDSVNSNFAPWSVAINLGGTIDGDAAGSVSQWSGGVQGIYRLHQYLHIGLGVGYYRWEKWHAMPVYITYMGDLSHNPFQGIFYYGSIGKPVAWVRGDVYDNASGVRYVAAGFGYKWKIQDINFYTTLGWVQQKSKAEMNSNFEDLRIFAPYDYKIVETINALEVKVGVTF